MVLSTDGVAYASPSLLLLSVARPNLQVCVVHHAPSCYRIPSTVGVLVKVVFIKFQMQTLYIVVVYSPGVWDDVLALPVLYIMSTGIQACHSSMR